MSGTPSGGANTRETMIEIFGSEEAYKNFMGKIGAEGGRNGHTGGFHANRELARRAGAKGGAASRRGKGSGLPNKVSKYYHFDRTSALWRTNFPSKPVVSFKSEQGAKEHIAKLRREYENVVES